MSPRLQPLLYRVIVYAGDTQVPWQRMPPLWPHDLAPARTTPLHVRHLALYSISNFTEIKQILAVCTGVQNLAFFCIALDPLFILYLDRIRPLLLSLHSRHLFAGPPDFSHAMFGNMSHFDLADAEFPAYNEDSWRSLAWLPCMTHLSLSLDFYFEENIHHQKRTRYPKPSKTI
ncbi:hypothetical protein C8J57DRAFT_1594633 [Mycena rebaudengoi]|nr:hypothetical protein C8J57DRAFT_1594633 [Mycena rebaudengoi]